MHHLHVLVDDMREGPADIIVRNPHIALRTLLRLDGVINELSMDNDMGNGPEGKHILYDALSQMQRPPYVIHIVTANPVAAQHMQQSLERFGYQTVDRLTYTRR